ncbi:MAG: hypothetical protein U5L06_12125 [Rhodovibrio sp.]|nr:hypothetical protein [Rhodovibrio sp.]
MMPIDDIMKQVAIEVFGHDDELVRAIEAGNDGSVRSVLDRKPKTFWDSFLARLKQRRKEESDVFDFLSNTDKNTG